LGLPVFRVLIVEDDFLTSEMLRGQVEELGLSVAGNATDGEEAVQLTRFLKPQLVLMDIGLPAASGLWATQRIQNQCATPIIVVTAHDTADWIQRAEAAGAGAYIVKPTCVADLEKAMMIALARFPDQQENRRLRRLLAQKNPSRLKAGWDASSLAD
jgi:two-component system, response regulator PdtaR